MADQGEMDTESGRKKSEDTSKCEPDPESNIHDFVAQEYEKQVIVISFDSSKCP